MNFNECFNQVLPSWKVDLIAQYNLNYLFDINVCENCCLVPNMIRKIKFRANQFDLTCQLIWVIGKLFTVTSQVLFCNLVSYSVKAYVLKLIVRLD